MVLMAKNYIDILTLNSRLTSFLLFYNILDHIIPRKGYFTKKLASKLQVQLLNVVKMHCIKI